MNNLADYTTFQCAEKMQLISMRLEDGAEEFLILIIIVTDTDQEL